MRAKLEDGLRKVQKRNRERVARICSARRQLLRGFRKRKESAQPFVSGFDHDEPASSPITGSEPTE